MANLITLLRIIFSIILVFLNTGDMFFYILYVLGGLSDVVDGIVARSQKTTSKFGSVFDTIADIIFFGVCAFKIAPSLNIPVYIWIWAALILLGKIVNIAICLLIKKNPFDYHTKINKVTGVLLFVIPLVTPLININISGIVVCLLASIAAIYENQQIRKEEKKDNKEEITKEN